ncbi:hypothetical protein GCG54_00003846 [Colletotrichum gloeosporioides]|uniref:Uncharacterized protein n=1 Tax=Colletotrichum gloeosporioides TaxID=474922 RepID=A0A8H4CE66_COLGL|nr:uncharacterized protein GCG54_00003846 [Colletotrichum gloeosporioides]KAF3802380.1 hypothetical protein GCG54_00003846 [Colletotrichum gloeosporioides]
MQVRYHYIRGYTRSLHKQSATEANPSSHTKQLTLKDSQVKATHQTQLRCQASPLHHHQEEAGRSHPNPLHLTKSATNSHSQQQAQPEQSHLSSTTIIYLHKRYIRAVVTSPPSSLRRTTQEAQIRHKNALYNQALHQKRKAINFSNSFPFTNIPHLITNRFLQAKATFSSKSNT